MESWISQYCMIQCIKKRNNKCKKKCLLGCGPYPIYCIVWAKKKQLKHFNYIKISI